MSDAIQRKKPEHERTLDGVSASERDASVDAKMDALVAELRKVRASVDSLLRASDLAQLKSARRAA